jgi:hypothetical protein
VVKIDQISIVIPPTLFLVRPLWWRAGFRLHASERDAKEIISGKRKSKRKLHNRGGHTRYPRYQQRGCNSCSRLDASRRSQVGGNKANSQRSLQEASPESSLIVTSARTRQSESKTRCSQAQPESFEHGRISHSLGQFRLALEGREGGVHGSRRRKCRFSVVRDYAVLTFHDLLERAQAHSTRDQWTKDVPVLRDDHLELKSLLSDGASLIEQAYSSSCHWIYFRKHLVQKARFVPRGLRLTKIPTEMRPEARPE